MGTDEIYHVFNPWTYYQLVEYWRPHGWDAISLARRVTGEFQPPAFRFHREYLDARRPNRPIRFVKSYAIVPGINRQNPRHWEEDVARHAYGFLCELPLRLVRLRMNWKTQTLIDLQKREVIYSPSRELGSYVDLHANND